MPEIIAAMIIACSNLTHSDAYGAEKKAQCVQRVAKCARGKLKKELSSMDPALDCSKEVHL